MSALTLVYLPSMRLDVSRLFCFNVRKRNTQKSINQTYNLLDTKVVPVFCKHAVHNTASLNIEVVLAREWH